MAVRNDVVPPGTAGGVVHPRQILETLGMIHALRKHHQEQEFDELH
jgi:hypothetical protein